jgi:4-hydroxy 2-oxovalerate aldolase
MAAEAQPIGSKGWLSYRPELKVLDCTIRDGGLINNHQFDRDLVRVVIEACAAAGVDYVELGYKTSRALASPAEYGPWKFCDEAVLREVVGDKPAGLKLSVMADADRTDYKTDIVPREQSVLDMVRVAAYIHQIPTAIEMIQDAHDKGYETTVNLMAVSTIRDWELDEALAALAQSPVDVLYLVDSFGTLYREQVEALMAKYHTFGDPAGKEFGIHAHNNCQLAYANSIEAIIQGANYIDASIAGLGRGAGNCQMELLLGFLHNPKFRLRPILQCIRDYIEPLRGKLRWGFSVPYMISGQLNQHPREAIRFMESGDSSDIVRFYDSMVEEE